MDPATRVCPFCGSPPGPGTFCERCGRNLAAVERLPTRAEWEAGRAPEEPAAPSPSPALSLAERCAEATRDFLGAMHGAGDPGATRIRLGEQVIYRRGHFVHGWVVRRPDREDLEEPKRNEPGLVLTVEGRFHRIDSELRGWGQRDFPHYAETVSPDPIEMPVEERLIDELAAIRVQHGASG
jgi:hypothetical protein